MRVLFLLSVFFASSFALAAPVTNELQCKVEDVQTSFVENQQIFLEGEGEFFLYAPVMRNSLAAGDGVAAATRTMNDFTFSKKFSSGDEVKVVLTEVGKTSAITLWKYSEIYMGEGTRWARVRVGLCLGSEVGASGEN